MWEERDVAEGGHGWFGPAGRQHGGYELYEGGWRGYKSKGGLLKCKSVLNRGFRAWKMEVVDAMR